MKKYRIIIVVIIATIVNLSITSFKPKEVEIITKIKTEPIYVINHPRIELINVCGEDTFKSWLDYRLITSQNSLQYKLQELAITNAITGIRMLENRYLVAMTSFYGNVGDKLDIKLESGLLLEVIIGDIKSSGHDYCQSTRDGSMIEFIVDSRVIETKTRNSGNFNHIFKGKITEIRKVKP